MGLVEIKRQPWMDLRKGVDSADTFLTSWNYNEAAYLAIAKRFSDGVNGVVPSEESKIKQLSQDIISPTLAFWGSDADAENSNYRVYGRRRSNGPIEIIAQGLVTLGARVDSYDPVTKESASVRWADTITETGEWIKPVTVINSGNDQITYLGFNAFGLEDIAVMFDMNTAAMMNCIITGA